jgi:hypothetical protein
MLYTIITPPPPKTERERVREEEEKKETLLCHILDAATHGTNNSGELM